MAFAQLRVLADTTFRVWNWVSIERPVAGSDCFTPENKRVSCVSGGSRGISDYRYGSRYVLLPMRVT